MLQHILVSGALAVVVVSGAVGAGRTEIWKLAPLKPGQQQLRFEYRRPWEQGVAPARIATYSVTVK